MLKMAERDQIVKNMMIKAGKLPGPIKAMKYMPINIPIIFHMLTEVRNEVTNGFIPTTAFNEQIEVMNAAFADAGITFSIQQIKTYSNSPYFSKCDDQGDAMKLATTISPEKYMNVWTCDSIYLGFAYMPSDGAESSYIHGVVLDYLALPKVDGYSSLPKYNEVDTLIHKTGHFLGLDHTFAGGCNGGDSVSDTAAEASPAYGMSCQSNPPRDTCPELAGVDPVTNYMDYSDDPCLNNFTPLQYARMRTMFLTYKPTLASMPPTIAPTKSPTKSPSISPIKTPTKSPTKSPTSNSILPTQSPYLPTKSPTSNPTLPTQAPTSLCNTILDKKTCNGNMVCGWQKVGKNKLCVYVPCRTLVVKRDCLFYKECKWVKDLC